MKLEHPSGTSPCDVISSILSKVVVMATGSTADNERDFAHNTRHYLRSSRGLTCDVWRAAERRLSESCSGKSQEYLHQLAVEAQRIWLEGFNGPRQSGPEKRMNFVSLQKKKAVNKKSLNSWLKRRRKAVNAAVRASSSSCLVTGDEADLKRKAKRRAGDAWSDGHDRKEGHLQSLIKKRRFEAQKSDQLLEDEKMGEAAFTALNKKQSNDDWKAFRKHQRVTASFEKKLTSLENLLNGRAVCLRRLPSLDEEACLSRLKLERI